MLRRTLPAAALLCASLWLGPAAQAHPLARVVLVDCVRGLDQAGRAAVFEGRMRAIAGAARLQMRFTLKARTPERRHWSTVAAPGFGEWATAAPGTARYVYTKRVENLLAPASYRSVVRFRWLDAAGRTLARAREVSPSCDQPDPRPNLVVRAIAVERVGVLDRRTYAVLVRNSGRAAAGPFAVALSVDGEAVAPAVVPGLEAGAATLVAIDGPACAPGAPLVAEVDPAGAVDERAEGDNVLGRACPASPA